MKFVKGICSYCVRHICGEEKPLCKLHTPLFYLAAVSNPVGLLTAMHQAGFEFSPKTDKFIQKEG